MSTLAKADPLRELSGTAAADAPPPVLLPYQQEWIADEAQLKVMEKSRRIGASWAEAADAVLIAAAEGGSNYFYISAAQDMAREFVEAGAMWARAFDYAAGEISEGVYDDSDDGPDAAKRYIKTFELDFPRSGRRIVALSSRPTNLRGKQGVIGIDEAAFAPDLAALLKAAMAMLMWGDKVRVWSTHFGVENPFNGLVNDIRAGRKGSTAEANVHRVTLDRAVSDGLFKRVCLRRGKPWTAEAEAAWVAQVRRFYGDDAAEELDVIPSQSGGAYLSLALIEQRMTTTPPPEGPVIVRGKWDDAFAYLPESVREHAIRGWCEEQIAPHLARLKSLLRHVFGQDFARNRDQSVITVLEEDTDLRRRPKITVELANCPFSCQEQILAFIIDRLPRFRGGAMDATGNGAALAEKMAQRYGVEMIEQVKLNDSFYLAHMPKLKAELQDGTLLDLARDDGHRDDLRAIKLVKGVPKLPDGDTQSAAARAAAAEGGSKLRRHGDFAIALFLAVYAFFREAGEIAWTPVSSTSSTFHEPTGNARGFRMRASDPEPAETGRFGSDGGW